MKRWLIALALLLSAPAFAQATSCLCTAGCKITTDAIAPSATISAPTSCAVYKNGIQIGSGPVVASTTIAANNTGVCAPSSAYAAGLAGSVSCLVTIPAQPMGSVTLTIRTANAQGESADSTALTFQNLSSLPTIPQVPVNPRVTP